MLPELCLEIGGSAGLGGTLAASSAFSSVDSRISCKAATPSTRRSFMSVAASWSRLNAPSSWASLAVARKTSVKVSADLVVNEDS